MTKVVCLSPYTHEDVAAWVGDSGAEILFAPDPPAPDAVRELVSDADIVISDRRHLHRLDRETLRGMTRCRLIQQPAAGFDAIDHRAAAEFGIPVANGGGHSGVTVADWVIMGMLNVLRQGGRQDREIHQGGWGTRQLGDRELGAMTVGILGFGAIGAAVAQRLSGFGTTIVYADEIERPAVAGARKVGFDELVAGSDIITLHIPLLEQTRHLFSHQEFARMRPGSFLVNASRGPIVDEQALIEALRSGHLGGAALDVFEVEPLPEDSPLRSMGNVFMTPHIGGTTRDALERLGELCASNIRSVLAGGAPKHVVNGVRG